jgi:hypothetical protein
MYSMRSIVRSADSLAPINTTNMLRLHPERYLWVFYVCVASWWRQSAVAGVVPSHYGTGIKHKLGIDATFPVSIGAGDIQLERDAVAIAITKTIEEDL